MPGRFQFSSPGAAFGGELTKILAERKAEERQKLIDSLSINADQRAEAAAREQTRMNNAELDNTAFNQKRLREQDVAARLNAMLSNRDLGWEVPDDADPDVLEYGDKLGAWNRKPVDEGPESFDDQGVPRPAPSTVVTPKTKRVYSGTVEQRKEKQMKDAAAAVAFKFMNSADPAEREFGQALFDQLEANAGKLPDSSLTRLGPKVPINIVDPMKGTITSAGSAAPGSENFARPQPQYHAPERDREVGVNADGHMVFIRPNNTTYVDTSQKFPTTGQSNALGIPQQLLERHEMNIRGLTESGGKVATGDLLAFEQTAMQIIDSANKVIPRKVREAAKLYVTDPYAFEQQMLAGTDFTPEEVEMLAQLKSQVGSPGVAAIIKANKPKKVGAAVVPGGGQKLEQVLLGRN